MKDRMPGTNLSIIQRFHCITILITGPAELAGHRYYSSLFMWCVCDCMYSRCGGLGLCYGVQ